MVEPLYVNTEGVLGLARVHDAVAAGLGQLQNASGIGIGAAAGPGTTHGLIAFGMHSALSGVMDRRDKILQSTGAAGQQMSEQLHRAAEAYRAGDEQGARGLSSGADGGVGAGHAAGAGLGGLSDPSSADSVGGHDNSGTDDRDHDRRDPERHEKGKDDQRILTVEHRADPPSQPGQPGRAADAQPATDLSAGATPPPRRPAQTRPQDI
ncbi:type VII secretion target [Mycolicibacterium sp. CBMA 361]|uniref:type VII secretion target n=1 Tax=Mycolicibacterium sp. CBMA 361 TaxID=2606610 RepID=UPI0012DE2282|nr:type VII secretion target [Mycolicibacterium sp. CBMA 361]MUM31609.1 hypothetical protein [Mycolicibacterium sp. CBMA 361]